MLFRSDETPAEETTTDKPTNNNSQDGGYYKNSENNIPKYIQKMLIKLNNY